MADKVAWYIPCMIWSRGGVSGRSVGGGKVWVVGWLCERVFYGYFGVKCVAGIFFWDFSRAGEWV